LFHDDHILISPSFSLQYPCQFLFSSLSISMEHKGNVKLKPGSFTVYYDYNENQQQQQQAAAKTQ